MKQHATLEGLTGIALIALWIALQCFSHSTSGFIHLLLGVGVVLVVRGIVTSAWGTPRPG